MKTIPSTYGILLDNIKDAEGGMLHRNRNERDITNRYGIYRGSRAAANFDKLWSYVDKVASSVTTRPSKTWTDAEILIINSRLDPEEVRYRSYLFYKKYFVGAHLDLFPEELVLLMANLYTNSPEGAWMSVQEALIDIQKDGLLDVPSGELSSVDGSYGRKTRDALIKFKEDADRKDKIIFKKSTLLAMKSYYIDLAVGNPDRFLIYLNGWDNRVENLEHK